MLKISQRSLGHVHCCCILCCFVVCFWKVREICRVDKLDYNCGCCCYRWNINMLGKQHSFVSQERNSFVPGTGDIVAENYV